MRFYYDGEHVLIGGVRFTREEFLMVEPTFAPLVGVIPILYIPGQGVFIKQNTPIHSSWGEGDTFIANLQSYIIELKRQLAWKQHLEFLHNHVTIKINKQISKTIHNIPRTTKLR